MPRRVPISAHSLAPSKISSRIPPAPAPPPSIWHPLPALPDATLPVFRSQAFNPAKPFLLPRNTFASLPAITKWFTAAPTTALPTLNTSYLQPYGDTLLPFEYITPTSSGDQFQHGSAPLALFLSWVSHITSSHRANRAANEGQKLYVAQAPLSLLPAKLHEDVKAPSYVQDAGKGDIYESSLWMGLAPTYTSMHRDPNPNLFVQMAGKKKIRILQPEVGDRIFDEMRKILGREEGERAEKVFRGEEMMVGKEREVLEELVWGQGKVQGVEEGWEAEVETGDGLFIPKGYWHSLKGIGDGLTASVNWWFR